MLGIRPHPGRKLCRNSPDDIRQILTDAGRHQLVAEIGAVGPPRREPAEDAAHLISSAPERDLCPNIVSGSWVDVRASPGSRLAVDQGLLCVELTGEGRGEEVVERVLSSFAIDRSDSGLGDMSRCRLTARPETQHQRGDDLGAGPATLPAHRCHGLPELDHLVL